MAYLRHGLILLYQKACQKASIRARFSHNFLFREGLRLILGKPPESGSARLGHIPSLALGTAIAPETLSLITTSQF